jgi:hypothetical protein
MQLISAENIQNSNEVQEAARDYLRKGWYPLPIPKGQKNPNLNGWPKFRVTETEIPNHFSNEQNIGLILGEASEGLTDVDLDCPEARKLARTILPKTAMVHGREGNPRSHFWYVCKPPQKTLKFLDPIIEEEEDKRKMLLELRCNGAQTVVPPSLHPSGERIVWHNEGEPTHISYNELHRRCSKLAALSLLLRYWPKKPGKRQEIALALAGALLRADWEPEEVEYYIERIAALAGDEQSDDRAEAVGYTLNRMDRGEPFTGWPRLSELLDKRIVNKVQEWLGIRRGIDISELIEGLSSETPPGELTDRLREMVPVLSSLKGFDLLDAFEKLKTHIPPKYLKTLENEVQQARKQRNEGESSDLESLEEHFPVHPALDFIDDAMTIGFRVDKKDSETGLVMVTSDSRGIRASIINGEVEIAGKKYKVSANYSPPFLRQLWSLERLRAFEAHPECPEGLFEDLTRAFKKFIDLPEPAYKLLAAWTVGTYFSPMFTAFPFLNPYGPKETGKSKLLEVLEWVCFNAVKNRDISVAALGDTVEGRRGTVLIDQAESLNPNLIGILADSYKKAGGKRRLVDTSGKRRVLEFATYGPKAFAATKDLDADLRDRCIRLYMVRTAKQLPDVEGNEPEWAELRDALYRFALLKFREVRKHYFDQHDSGSRIKELWRPLEAVLKALQVDEAEITSINKFFADAIAETRHELDDWEASLFDILKGHAAQKPEGFRLTAEETSAAMISELGLAEAERKPKPRWVGERIKKYKLAPKSKRQYKDDKRVSEYTFDSTHVLNLYNIYVRE